MRAGSRFAVRGSRFALFAALALGALTLPAPRAVNAQNPVVLYPAAGNLRAEQGTIEMWFRFEEEPSGKGERALHYFPLFFINVEGEKQQRVSLGYQTIWGANHFHFFFSSLVEVEGKLMQSPYVTTVEEGQGTKPDPRGPHIFIPRMHKGDWHLLALAWSNGMTKTAVSMYLDGRLVIRPTELPGALWGDMDATSFRLMNAPYHDNIAVDELRVSDIARTAEQVTNSFTRGAFVRDEYTLLLDHCDKLDGDQTVAELISGFRGEKGGKLLNKCYELVDSKFGRAIRLTAEPKP
jgi:hypothetical protein